MFAHSKVFQCLHGLWIRLNFYYEESLFHRGMAAIATVLNGWLAGSLWGRMMEENEESSFLYGLTAPLSERREKPLISIPSGSSVMAFIRNFQSPEGALFSGGVFLLFYGGFQLVWEGFSSSGIKMIHPALIVLALIMIWASHGISSIVKGSLLYPLWEKIIFLFRKEGTEDEH